MKIYHSFITTNPWHAGDLAEIAIPDQWSLTTVNDLSRRHWVSKDRKGRTTQKIPVEESKAAQLLEDSEPAVEILIHAATDAIADNVLSLIRAGLLLGYPDVMQAPNETTPIEYGGVLTNMIASEPSFFNRYTFQDNARYACQVARRAWDDTRSIYAIEKYMLSIDLDSFTPHSANPRYGHVFANDHSEHRYHVKAGFAIVLAHSVIEELGLEIRSSGKNPRFLNGQWNPAVFDDIVERLGAKGVDPDDLSEWVLRGEPTEMHSRMWEELRALPPYAEEGITRDIPFSIVDAIQVVAVMRNYIFGHKFDEVARAVSPYDVFNAQSVARRLILSSLGLYKTKDEKIIR